MIRWARWKNPGPNLWSLCGNSHLFIMWCPAISQEFTLMLPFNGCARSLRIEQRGKRLQRGVACSFAQPIDTDMNQFSAGYDAGQRVCRSDAEAVMRMNFDGFVRPSSHATSSGSQTICSFLICATSSGVYPAIPVRTSSICCPSSGEVPSLPGVLCSLTGRPIILSRPSFG